MAYRFNNIKVLIVEDEAAMVQLIKSVLDIFGVGQILVARDGQEGFDAYLEHNPDLIITDWMMKPVDGITMIQEIRKNTRGPNKFVPIIMMTGFSQKKRVCMARDVGTTEFMVKPFNVHDLYKRISQIIEKPRQFVKSSDFFGPDRRRHNDNRPYRGPLRRTCDEEKRHLAEAAKKGPSKLTGSTPDRMLNRKYCHGTF